MQIAFFLSSRNVVPPEKTGGIEQPAYYLIRELIKRGHKITIFSAPGSKIKGARVKEMAPFNVLKKIPRGQTEERVANFYDTAALADFFACGEQANFDLLQFNGYLFYQILPFVRFSKIPILVQINYPHPEIYSHIKKIVLKNKNLLYLPMSEFIKTAMPGLNYSQALYPAIDFKDFPLSCDKRKYLLSIGRICPEKGTHLAIEVAKKTGHKLVIAGPISPSNQGYFNDLIEPAIDNKNTIYVGEVDLKTKIKLYQQAIAALFPIQWDEPFGIVLIESMACGTPVVAFDRAAIREIVQDGVNGFIVKDGAIDKMAAALMKLPRLSRETIRASAQEKFSVEKQTDIYEKICQRILSKN